MHQTRIYAQKSIDTEHRGLRADHISFAYHTAPLVVNKISLALHSGEFWGLIGPNGAGKSTLLRLLAGLKKPCQGRVLLDGQDLSHLSRLERARHIGFLPQQVLTEQNIKCEHIVAQGRYPHLGAFGFLRHHDQEVVKHCMQVTQTTAFRQRLLSELSGGERQRVLLAAVLAQQARYLLLDEPAAALDLHHQVAVFALLRQLCSAGLAVVVVTHDLNLAAQYCDHLALLAAGAVRAQGSPEQVLQQTLLEEVYQAPLDVGANPATGRPMVFLQAP